ncbi:MAG: hypothetical protein A2Y25_09920 [Candidatus Melainabacteria bacterium GWF2_37_15]|nr:MAG: hypothetical protein A2Y25_09920 [Candidatus Melainabacteria bacterium GWF2_37_15]
MVITCIYRGDFMQITGISENLSTAITFLEEILNNKDGEAVIENIKNYKKTKNQEEFELI